MGIKKITKVLGLNIGISVIDIILFSPGLLGIQLGGTSILSTTFGATAIIMSIVIFVTGNYMLLMKKAEIIHIDKIITPQDCINALTQNYSKKTFENDIDVILNQIESFHHKKETIEDILLQKFNRAEMSYAKFNGTIADIENVFYMNIKSVLNKLNAFDEYDYKRISKDNAQNKFSQEFIQAKMNIYNEYISFIKDATEDNEQIILKLDKLLLEISKFNSLEDGELENMDAMEEIDELINKTKNYK